MRCVRTLEVGSRHPKTKFSTQGRFVFPRGTDGQRTRDRQGLEEEGEGDRRGEKRDKGED